MSTTVPRRSLEELVAGSGQILHGRVLRHWVEWDASHRFLWTHYSAELTDVLKGAAGSTFTISEAGGTLDGLTMSIPGVVQFTDGEEVVVFLHRMPLGQWRTYGYTQGKFAVRGRGAGMQPRVFTDSSGLTLVDVPPTRVSGRTALTRLNGTRLTDFKARVRELVRKQARQ